MPSRFNAVESSTPTDAIFSPDGRWVAYSATEERPCTVFVEPFPPTGTKYELPKNATSRITTCGLQRAMSSSTIRDPGDSKWCPCARGRLSRSVQPWRSSRNFQAGPPAARRDFDMTPGGEILGFITPGGAVTAPSEPDDPELVPGSRVEGTAPVETRPLPSRTLHSARSTPATESTGI